MRNRVGLTESSCMAGRENKLPPLSPAQLQIMTVVWRRGEVTVADVWDAISKSRPIARNTVVTVMTRLEKKGWLQHRAEGQTFFYSATVERASALGELVSRVVDTAFAGSADGLIMALLEGRGISAEEAARIRTMIEDKEKGQ
jgi:BlaI family penicillinase repressor